MRVSLTRSAAYETLSRRGQLSTARLRVIVPRCGGSAVPATCLARLSQKWDNYEGATCPGCRRETAALGRVLQARFSELSCGGQGGRATLSVSRSSAVLRRRRSRGRGSVRACWRSSSRTTETRIERCTRFASRKPCTSCTRFRRNLRPASRRPSEMSILSQNG